ncbi:PIN domain-containing protein [Planktothrix agardhii]|jgi:predicted nucleic acid-binding protein|uniref:PIN domain-containing protein n=2 Tax=Planktothrix agardhii TaxID=1160 RepID=A0A1J1JE67_PLAAG|nr:PIN domain-containing protein [Planktothrix agardhii]MCB8787638.1 PIN domain-containing protein [Planktothrix agardhii 1025]MCF3577893.1 PIN domain-containing protein [Planktothrix agardhii 1812]MCF3581686.1 PIN domain-containing protein [Planktothrix agardhii 1811]MCF3610590.1 PIN domain-containing protein [Planktothrix agardhii 1027]MCF3644191.1 PIN domain-containing protein [Planktothrix agardhii 1026]
MMHLVVDANILVSELLRQRGKELIQNPGLILYVTESVLSETSHELRKRINAIIHKKGASEELGEKLLEAAQNVINTKINIIEESVYIHLETEARNRIPRDPNDWSTVALALVLNAAIWTQDCDFLGCGCPTWTTETLLTQLTVA